MWNGNSGFFCAHCFLILITVYGLNCIHNACLDIIPLFVVSDLGSLTLSQTSILFPHLRSWLFFLGAKTKVTMAIASVRQTKAKTCMFLKMHNIFFSFSVSCTPCSNHWNSSHLPPTLPRRTFCRERLEWIGVISRSVSLV